MFKYVEDMFSLPLPAKLLFTFGLAMICTWVVIGGPNMVYDTVVEYEGPCDVMLIDKETSEISCNDHQYSTVEELSDLQYFAHKAVATGDAAINCRLTRREDLDAVSFNCKIE